MENVQWEETFQEGIYKNSIVLVENLELDVSSKELEVREERRESYQMVYDFFSCCRFSLFSFKTKECLNSRSGLFSISFVDCSACYSNACICM